MRVIAFGVFISILLFFTVVAINDMYTGTVFPSYVIDMPFLFTLWGYSILVFILGFFAGKDL